MAHDLNQCGFIGRLGADPESRFMTSGEEVSNFRIACGWKTKDKEGVEWVPVVAYGKLAEICNAHLRKGSKVFIQGRFRTRQWEKNGEKRYSTEIHADLMQMLGSKATDDAGTATPPAARPVQAANQTRPAAKSSLDNFDDFEVEPCQTRQKNRQRSSACPRCWRALA